MEASFRSKIYDGFAICRDLYRDVAIRQATRALPLAVSRALTNMGSVPSKSDGCMAALCGRKDDAYVGSEYPFAESERMDDDQRPISLARIEPQIEGIGRRIELEASALGYIVCIAAV